MSPKNLSKKSSPKKSWNGSDSCPGCPGIPLNLRCLMTWVVLILPTAGFTAFTSPANDCGLPSIIEAGFDSLPSEASILLWVGSEEAIKRPVARENRDAINSVFQVNLLSFILTSINMNLRHLSFIIINKVTRLCQEYQ